MMDRSIDQVGKIGSASKIAGTRRSRGLGDMEYRALGRFRRTLREFLAVSEAGALEHGVTSQQHQALLAIRAHEGPAPMSIGELAECLLIKSHSAVGLVSRLEDRALIVRRESPEDRRRACLELLPRGLGVLEAISTRNMREIGRVSEVLTEIVRATKRLSATAKPDPPKERRSRQQTS